MSEEGASGIERPTPDAQRLFLELKPRLDVCNGCTECWLRCEDGVQADREEWSAIEAYLASADQETRERIERVSGQDKTVDLGDEVSVTMCRFFRYRAKKLLNLPGSSARLPPTRSCGMVALPD